jgi:hypothetical protein
LQHIPDTPSALNPAVPMAWERVILKLLEKERSARYQCAGDMLSDFRRLKRQPPSVNLEGAVHNAKCRPDVRCGVDPDNDLIGSGPAVACLTLRRDK